MLQFARGVIKQIAQKMDKILDDSCDLHPVCSRAAFDPGIFPGNSVAGHLGPLPIPSPPPHPTTYFGCEPIAGILEADCHREWPWDLTAAPVPDHDIRRPIVVTRIDKLVFSD
jgi:hypothetical protein